MNDDQELLQRPLLSGKRVIAEYAEAIIPAYRGNPLIEALPEIYEPEEVSELFTTHPRYEEEQRMWSSTIRRYCVDEISNFMQPLPHHINLEGAISRMIRLGYEGRNPLDSSYARQFSVGFKAIREAALNDDGRNLAGIAPTALGHALIGVSGIGKSTAINHILQLYPQVIQHTRYNGRQLILKQLVWLKLECPASGSLGVLCQNFFRQVDLALGTNSYREHVKSRATKETMLDPMAQIAARQGLGILVIDEIQRLRLNKNSGQQEVLAYLTEFVNTIGVPVLLIGTYRSLFLFESMFAEARRGSGQIDPIWSPMANDDVWTFFMEELWRFQWTRKKNPLTRELLDLFYEESQGITDIAVKLYKAAQWEVIGRENEEITRYIVQRAAKKYLRLVQPLLQALRIGDIEKLRRIPDLKPEWATMNDYIESNQSTIVGRLATEHARALRKQGPTQLITELMNLGTELGLSPLQAQEKAEEIIQSSTTTDRGFMKKQMATAALQSDQGQDLDQSARNDEKGKTSTKRAKQMTDKSDSWKEVVTAAKSRASIRDALLVAEFLKPPTELNLLD